MGALLCKRVMVLSVSLYSIDEFPFSKSVEETLIVTPSPLISDAVREELLTKGLGGTYSTLTISKFVGDLLSGHTDNVELSSKYEIVQKLSLAWINLVGTESYNEFLSAYNLFSKLRGFSTDFLVLEEILDEYGTKIKNSLRAFWDFFEILGLVDEHEAYKKLRDTLDTNAPKDAPPLEGIKKIVFWGFDYLSAVQIDFLRNLSKTYEVEIFYLHDLYTKRRSSDWISWVDNDLEEKESSKENIQVEIFRFPKFRFAQRDIQALRGEKNIVFPVSNLEIENILEIESTSYKFSASVDIFSEKNEMIRLELKAFCSKKFKDLLSFLEKKKLEVKKERLFRELKIYHLYKEVTLEFLGLTDRVSEEEVFNEFYLENIFYLVSLKLPRNQVLPISLEEKKMKCLSLNEYLNSFTGKCLLIGTSYFQGLKGSPEKMSELVSKKLSSLGPLYNNQQKFNLFHLKLANDLKKKKVFLALEEALEEIDSGWSEILKNLDVTNTFLTAKNAVELGGELTEAIERPKYTRGQQKLSFSKLQCYLECPKKFHFEYVESFSSFPDYSHRLRADELGNLEHKLIETYLKKYKKLEDQSLRALAFEMVHMHFKKRDVLVDKVEYGKITEEVYTYARHGIESLLSFYHELGGTNLHFEQLVQDEQTMGRIDCLVETEKGSYIFDFKRSGASIPSKAQIEKLDKIQLPFYLSKTKDVVLGVGYLDLSQPQESIVFLFNEEKVTSLKSSKLKYEELKSDYLALEKETLLRLELETEFLARPRNAKVCDFCSMQNICERGLSG